MKEWLKRLLRVAILFVVSVIYVAVTDSGTLSVHYADSKTPEHQQLKVSLAPAAEAHVVRPGRRSSLPVGYAH